MSALRTCYRCGASGRRGVFECDLCRGQGKLDGPPAPAPADSFRRGILQTAAGRKPAKKRAPVITVRRKKRVVRPNPEGEP